jgi:DNA-directed RNA polymerase specialized sigma24 family protein
MNQYLNSRSRGQYIAKRIDGLKRELPLCKWERQVRDLQDDIAFHNKRLKRFEMQSDQCKQNVMKVVDLAVNETQRKALMMKYIEGCSDEEISKALGVNEQYTHTAQSRILRKHPEFNLE